MTENDRPTIGERYMTARQTSDLSLDVQRAGNGPAEVLVAAGWAAQHHEAAMLLWEVTHQGRAERKERLIELLGADLNARMEKDRRLKGDAWRIARQMVAWFLYGVCKPCGGLGYERPKGSPALTNKLCTFCEGRTREEYPKTAAHIWMEGHLGRLQTLAAGKIMQGLARSMEL